MQLDSKVAIQHGFIKDKNGVLLNEDDYNKASSIDITIGEILYKDKNNEIKEGTCSILRPQESLVIISEEIIHVPEDYIAYVFLKNRLSQKGLLALNTGIVDSGFSGPISTVIINFSDVDATINIGKEKLKNEFFRVVFHKISGLEVSTNTSDGPLTKKEYTNKQYEEYKEARKTELKNLPKTFLDPVFLEKRIEKGILKRLSDFSLSRLLGVVSILAFLLTFIQIGKSEYINWRFNTKEDIIKLNDNENKISALEDKVGDLEKRMASLKNGANDRD